MASVDATSFDAALKDFYTDEYVRDMTYEQGGPLYSMITKKTNCGGRQYIQPIQYGVAQSVSSDFSVAQANKDTNKYEDFQIPWADTYGLISISRKIMLQTEGAGRKAFFEAQTREIDGMLKTVVNRAAYQMYRNGGGSIGQVNASGPSTTTFTLLEPEEICLWAKNMRIVASANDGTSSAHTLLNSGAVGVVSSVNRDTGVITSASNWTTQIASLAASSYLFPEGSFGGANGQTIAKGLLAWLPTTAPTSGDSFHSVDRSLDPTYLGGIRVSATGIPIREAIRVALARLGREGQYADIAMMSHQKFRDLCIELDNKTVYTQVTNKVGFEGATIVGGKRPVVCYPDHNCPDNQIFLLNKSTWALVALSGLPDMHDEDGRKILREATSPGYEVRASTHWNLACSAPGANAVLTVET